MGTLIPRLPDFDSPFFWPPFPGTASGIGISGPPPPALALPVSILTLEAHRGLVARFIQIIPNLQWVGQSLSLAKGETLGIATQDLSTAVLMAIRQSGVILVSRFAIPI